MSLAAGSSARAPEMCQQSAPAGDQGRELEKIFAIDRAESDSGQRGGHRGCDSDQVMVCECVMCSECAGGYGAKHNYGYLSSEIRRKLQSLLL